jgi:hypothetical protein
MTRSWAACAILAVTACRGATPPATISGAVRGVTLKPKDAIVRLHRDGGVVKGVVVTLGATDHLCDDARANVLRQGTSSLSFWLQRLDDQGHSSTDLPGEYPVSSFPYSVDPNVSSVLALFSRLDAQCLPDKSVFRLGNGGSLHLGAIDLRPGGTADGTFQVQFGADKGGDRIPRDLLRRQRRAGHGDLPVAT